jgi:hypothetical protein
MIEGSALYCLLEKPVSTSSLENWPQVQRVFSTVIGYSGLGHVFLRSDANEYAVLHPFRTAYKNYGYFASRTEFELAILRDDDFAAIVLQHSHQDAIRELLGPLEEGEVYIPAPYPFLGGDESPESYDRGDVWVFLDIIGQMLN